MKTAPTPCTKEEIDAIIDKAADNDFYFTLFNVAKTTGRRLGEYYEVKVKDIDFDKDIMMTTILKRRMKYPKRKTSKSRKMWVQAIKILRVTSCSHLLMVTLVGLNRSPIGL
jgi:integrase